MKLWKIIMRQNRRDRVRPTIGASILAIESYMEDYNRIAEPNERFTAKNNRQRMLELCTLKYEQEN